MKKSAVVAIVCLFIVALFAPLIFTQDFNKGFMTDQAETSVGRVRPFMEGAGVSMPHPYHVEARHWPQGCDKEKALYDATGSLPRFVADQEESMRRRNDSRYAPRLFTAESATYTDDDTRALVNRCGERFLDYDGENLVTSAGETAISKAMSDTAAQPASANYVALTNTAITPAVADTTLSGEISTNGLQRAQGTFTDTSAAIGAPPTPGAISQVGTAGAVTVDYWVFPCTFQGCTAVGSGTATTTSNATLSTTVYNTFTFTGKLGAAFYRVIRTHNGSTPSGALAGGSCATMTTAGCDGEISVGAISCATSGGLVAGTAPTCTVVDQSNVISAFTVPGSDQTFVGKYTLTKTFTATGTQAAQAFGILNASSTGTLYFEGTFTQASLVTNDTLAFTETVYH